MSTTIMQISQLLRTDPSYPDILRDGERPPSPLYCLGTLPDGPYLAVVGTRRPTSYGRHMAYQLAGELAAAGFVIVSGLATGIDGIAHQAAIDAGGRTVAVQGRGLDGVYPSSNRQLARDILSSGGAIVSEFDVGTPPLPGNFVRRNRIIAGLSVGVIFVEGAAGSGAMHTVNAALRMSRTVMAVPGHVTSSMSAGPNNVLREGAVPITGSHDVLVDFSELLATRSAGPIQLNDPREQLVIDLLNRGNDTTQKLVVASNLPPSELADIMSLMEISGKLRNLGAGQWAPRIRT